MTDTPKPDPNTPPLFWRPCMKRPVVVHVRDATPGEEVFTREGLTIANGDDLVMRGIDGEVYPIGRSIFERTYDLLPEGAAVVADSPELAQARADASRRLTERDAERAIIDGLRAALGLRVGVGLDLAALTAVARDKLSEDDMESADAIDGLVREADDLRAAAETELAEVKARVEACKVAASGNCADWCRMLDEARERIAALEDERVHVKQVADTWQAVTDGLNARIVALEAEQKADAEACAKATWTAVVLVTERDAALARVRELEAAAQPKPRDESAPPPGWHSCGVDGRQVSRGATLASPRHSYDIAEAWRIYDAEHGYAPPDEAAIRADERRRTERDVAAYLRSQGAWGFAIDNVERSAYPMEGA